MRLRLALWTALAATLVAAPSLAAPCQKPRQLKLNWSATGNQAQLVYVAYGCPLPPSCPTKAGTPATRLPLKVSLSSGGTELLKTELAACAEASKCRSLNTGGCDGGTDAHKDNDGLIKVVFPRRGGASVTARVRGSMPRPPEIKGPVTITLTDAAGYSAEATYTKCRGNSRPSTTTLLCR